MCEPDTIIFLTYYWNANLRIIVKTTYHAKKIVATYSSQNDVERAQSFVADAVCDGGALDWEHKKMFEGLAGDEIQSLTAQETANLEADG